MQLHLRETASSHLKEEVYNMFVSTHAEGKLVKPEDSGYVTAGLALKAPKALSGQFVNWNGEECKEFRRST